VLAVGLAYATFCSAFGALLPALLSLVSNRSDFLAQIPLLLGGGALGLWYLRLRPTLRPWRRTRSC
jgi:hypothetical protein